MSWISPDQDDVKQRLSGPEFATVEAEALATGEGNPWPSLIAEVVEAIRGYIGGGSPKNTLGAGATIPGSCKRHAMSLVIWDGLTRFGIDRLLTEARKKDYESANRYFEKVAAGSIVVEQPETAATDADFRNREGGVEVVNPEVSTKRKATRGRMNGLI